MYDDPMVIFLLYPLDPQQEQSRNATLAGVWMYFASGTLYIFPDSPRALQQFRSSATDYAAREGLKVNYAPLRGRELMVQRANTAFTAAGCAVCISKCRRRKQYVGRRRRRFSLSLCAHSRTHTAWQLHTCWPVKCGLDFILMRAFYSLGSQLASCRSTGQQILPPGCAALINFSAAAAVSLWEVSQHLTMYIPLGRAHIRKWRLDLN
jgi:hypothetical protein